MAGGFTRLECGVNFVVQPVAIQSLKEVVIQTLESWILSGELVIGEKLPSERDLAQKMKISRPVLHEAHDGLCDAARIRRSRNSSR